MQSITFLEITLYDCPNTCKALGPEVWTFNFSLHP